MAVKPKAIMLLYKTTYAAGGASFQGSQTESSKARTALKAQGFSPETRTIEVPTSKAGLLAWLNENVST